MYPEELTFEAKTNKRNRQIEMYAHFIIFSQLMSLVPFPFNIVYSINSTKETAGKQIKLVTGKVGGCTQAGSAKSGERGEGRDRGGERERTLGRG